MASSIGASTKVSTGSSAEEAAAAGHGGKVQQPPLSKPWEWKSVKPPSKDLPLSPPKSGKKDVMPEMNLRKGGVLGLSSPSNNKGNEAKSKNKVDSREQQAKIRAGAMEASKAEENDEQQNSSAIGLKLGKRTYLEDGEAGNKTPTTPMQTAAAATSSPCWKKGRGSPQGSVTPKCQVEGCKADLAGSKDYHRRHKVCEVHSKTPKNTVNGQEQRFCQQCSRFHLLAEFDEGKRSCRRRLAGHNERRRKPQPDALAAYSMGNGSSFQASYQRLGSSIIVDGHGDAIAYGGGSWHQQFLGKQLPENLSAEKLLMLLQNSKRPTTTTTTATVAKKDQIGLTLSSSSPGGGVSSHSSHGVTSMSGSSRALSLLSSEPWSPTTNESPSSVSYDRHLSAAANNNNSSTQYLMMGRDVSSAAVDNTKFQQQQQSMQQQAQAQDAIPISSSPAGSSNKGQHQPYASPIRMVKSFENHSGMLALMHGQALQVASSQARPAIDLMQAPSSQQASQQQKRTSSPGATQYMHSMKPFESQVFESL